MGRLAMSGRPTAELATNVEARRAGEVALGILGGDRDGFAWVSIADARDFARRILVAARYSEDLL